MGAFRGRVDVDAAEDIAGLHNIAARDPGVLCLVLCVAIAVAAFT